MCATAPWRGPLSKSLCANLFSVRARVCKSVPACLYACVVLVVPVWIEDFRQQTIRRQFQAYIHVSHLVWHVATGRASCKLLLQSASAANESYRIEAFSASSTRVVSAKRRQFSASLIAARYHWPRWNAVAKAARPLLLWAKISLEIWGTTWTIGVFINHQWPL